MEIQNFFNNNLNNIFNDNFNEIILNGLLISKTLENIKTNENKCFNNSNLINISNNIYGYTTHINSD